MKFKRDYNMQNLMYTPRDRLFVVNWEKGGGHDDLHVLLNHCTLISLIIIDILD